MIRNAFFQIMGLTDVIAAAGFALQDIDAESHVKLVKPKGFQPSTFPVSPGRATQRVDAFDFGGAEGIRTLDLLDAIEARFQLRHGPTGVMNFYNTRFR